MAETLVIMLDMGCPLNTSYMLGHAGFDHLTGHSVVASCRSVRLSCLEP